MPTETHHLSLASGFPPATREMWLKLVDGVLKGAPFERLKGKTADGLTIEPIYPREAIKDNIASGKVVARLQVDEKGLVTSVTIVEANPRRVFDREVIKALSQWKFKPEGDRYIAEIEISFVLN